MTVRRMDQTPCIAFEQGVVSLFIGMPDLPDHRRTIRVTFSRHPVWPLMTIVTKGSNQ
jgi:hypothetical protein